MGEPFAPTLAAARARIDAVRPAAYARTRNALDGAVSGLSPYITQGSVTLADVLDSVAAPWWVRASRGLDSAADLLAVNEEPAR